MGMTSMNDWRHVLGGILRPIEGEGEKEREWQFSEGELRRIITVLVSIIYEFLPHADK